MPVAFEKLVVWVLTLDLKITFAVQVPIAVMMPAAVIAAKFGVLPDLLGGKQLGHSKVIAQMRGSKIALCRCDARDNAA